MLQFDYDMFTLYLCVHLSYSGFLPSSKEVRQLVKSTLYVCVIMEGCL